jgi:hypothetical protein
MRTSWKGRDRIVNVFMVLYTAVIEAGNFLVHVDVEDLKIDRNFECRLESCGNGTKKNRVHGEMRRGS